MYIGHDIELVGKAQLDRPRKVSNTLEPNKFLTLQISLMRMGYPRLKLHYIFKKHHRLSLMKSSLYKELAKYCLLCFQSNWSVECKRWWVLLLHKDHCSFSTLTYKGHYKELPKAINTILSIKTANSKTYVQLPYIRGRQFTSCPMPFCLWIISHCQITRVWTKTWPKFANAFSGLHSIRSKTCDNCSPSSHKWAAGIVLSHIWRLVAE